MLRKLVLVGLMVLGQGSTMQLIAGILFSLIFFLFQVQSQPYIDLFDDYLASAASFALVVVLLCAYAFKEDALLALPDIRGKMSTEQDSIYVLNTWTLTMILLAGVIGALVCSGLIFLIQLVEEGKRLRSAERLKQARRLRDLNTGEEVDPPKLGKKPDDPRYTAGPFHVFLSHNWAQGQSEMRIIKTRLKEMMPTVSVFLECANTKAIIA